MFGILRTEESSAEALNTASSAGSEMMNALTKLISGASEEMADEDKKRMEAAILRKLEAGKKLTAKEIAYLKKYNPMLYQKYLRIQKMAEAMKEQLKHVRSKQQANAVICRSIGGVSDKDPDRQYIVAAMNEAAREFLHSRAYAKLPNTDEEAKERKTKQANRFGEDACGEQDNLLSWSPLQEIIDMQPTFTGEA